MARVKAVGTWLTLRSRNSRRLAALLCLTLFLVLEIFAASSGLHHSLHADSTAPGHTCVLTLLAQGQFDVPAVGLTSFVVMLGFLFSLPAFHAATVSPFDYRLAPTRGPPRF